MTDLLGAVVPPDLDVTATLLLIGLSFFTSAVTATIGVGGGVVMIAALVLAFPPVVAVPVHGLIQFGSNAGRATLMRAHVQWRFAAYFVLGSAVGALAGAQVATLLPEGLFTAIIAGFVLWSVWGPQPTATTRGPAATALAGLVTSALGMITGASGPLVIAFLRFLPDRRQIIATHALLMACQHILKALAFSLFGFAFAPYLPFVVAMMLSGLVGTSVGGVLLDRMPEAGFRIAFRVLLTLVALELLRSAVFA